MPKYKKSKGKCVIVTPHKEFSDWFRAELLNSKAWNPGWIETDGRTRFKTEQWVITVLATKIIVESEKPVVSLRKGLRIFMGRECLEIN